ncbi:RagB/SusD family nutrient uptake outer membrane protein [Marinifilum sp. D737]|uniref:RagB/SusD family nutrient uptake outer membrane protein n=1 Tax=Marinifilum sp. D737 TaxID=2969628 RepID=UPI00227287AF|nr:RagB/SusD family nutrient uptake outer membrane protein [Marinifilum sp. D737]MCY1634803.1 RagB/SusD family nutrient uptake outer membrane protein [Marinifilum sp. D737]
MKKIYRYAFIASALFAFFGCEDLDTIPEGDNVTTEQKEEVVLNDPSKAQAGVNGIFAQFSQMTPNEDALGASRHNDFGYPSVMLFSDANGMDVVQEDNGYNWSGNDLDYTDRIHTSNECQIIWNDMYYMIRGANNVIGSIDPETDDETIQFYLAQGLAARAFSYWNLAQLFQFNYVGHETAPCVPIITEKNAKEIADNGGAPRATVQEVYDLILADINKAIDLFTIAEGKGIKRDDKRYINLAVAYGLRARINLTMHRYSEAAADATSAIAESGAAPSSIKEASDPAFWTVDESNWMWGIIISETDAVVNSGIVNWISHMGSFNYGYCWYNGGKQINKALFNTIASTDVRKGWWLDGDGNSDNLTDEEADVMAEKNYPAYTQVKFAPYKEELRASTNANDIPLMRIEEMYLIKAEAEAMSGGDGKTTLENFINNYRDPSYVCPVSGTDIQDEVYRHRRIELWGEGLNWFDIMRLNKDVDRRGGGYPNASMVFHIPAGSDILLWRLPEAEIEANSLLTNADNNPSASVPEPVADVD